MRAEDGESKQFEFEQGSEKSFILIDYLAYAELEEYPRIASFRFRKALWLNLEDFVSLRGGGGGGCLVLFLWLGHRRYSCNRQAGRDHGW